MKYQEKVRGEISGEGKGRDIMRRNREKYHKKVRGERSREGKGRNIMSK